jgi:ubiquinone/menaquinone biosynthesis C-methylase UbiE
METLSFTNSYADTTRAAAYAKLDFPGTYYLAFRDLPELINAYASKGKAIDFGCGAGRSTRFLKSMGYETTGLDISAEMLALAHQLDKTGHYQLINDGQLNGVQSNQFELILSAFTFDNISTLQKKTALFREFYRVLKAGGCMINLVSSPELYVNDWASFKTTCFPHNFTAQSGDIVNTIITDTDDHRPVDDVLCTDGEYRKIYAETGFKLLKTHKPLATGNEPIEWVNEIRIAPWTIYVLRKSGDDL